MLRITNSMMKNNTKNNINLNKTTADKMNTQVATGQKISRPSDDPVIAIRALRLNTNLSELNQFYDKNIPDAKAWLNVTETALSQTDGIFSSIKENLTTGASDDNTASDRQKILENLKAMRDQIYASGNADYAGRTVFTGYRTGEPLIYKEDSNVSFTMTEPFTANSVEEIKYVKGTASSTTTDVETISVNRLRLAYDKVDDSADVTLTIDGVDTVLTAQPKSDAAYMNPPCYIAETGEIILDNDLKAAIEGADEVTVTYSRAGFEKGELKPEHYFSCIDGDGVAYNGYVGDNKSHFENQELKVEISFEQTITINTHADAVYTHDMGRDVDELIVATQKVVDAEQRLSKLAETDPDYNAAKKSLDLLKENMQKLFSLNLKKFDGYSDRTNLAIANIGSMQSRLAITRERVADQIQSFTELADENINIELTDSAIELKNAQLALEAAQQASAKIAQQSLLNYL